MESHVVKINTRCGKLGVNRRNSIIFATGLDGFYGAVISVPFVVTEQSVLLSDSLLQSLTICQCTSIRALVAVP